MSRGERITNARGTDNIILCIHMSENRARLRRRALQPSAFTTTTQLVPTCQYVLCIPIISFTLVAYDNDYKIAYRWFGDVGATVKETV